MPGELPRLFTSTLIPSEPKLLYCVATMIRPILTEVALFLTPFVLYALFLAATRAGVLDLKQWSVGRIAWLAIAAFVLMIGSFAFLAQFDGAPMGSTYTPAHVEDGVLVPGTNQ
jgi:hypothetical protein